MPTEPSSTPRHILTVNENNWEITLSYTAGAVIVIDNESVNLAIEENPTATGVSLGLGSAAYADTTDFATAAQGAAVDSATSDGNANPNEILKTDETGKVTVTELDATTINVSGTLNANHIHGNIAGSVYAHIRAGEALAKGDPVYISGSHGDHWHDHSV